MRIAFFTDSYLPQWDGVVSTILGFRKELEREGHEVYIFAAGSRKDKEENKDPHVYYHASTPFKPYPEYRVALFPYLSERRVRKLGIDVIHTHGMATMGLAALTIAKVCVLNFCYRVVGEVVVIVLDEVVNFLLFVFYSLIVDGEYFLLNGALRFLA